MNETREIARFVSHTSFGDIPPEFIDRAKVYVLDNLASGFIGSVQPWSKIVANLSKNLGGSQEASIFGNSWKTDVSRAALVNGVMIGAFEVEHVGHLAHPGGTVFPAALALAQRNHSNGKTFLTSMLLGYEVTCRVGEAQTRSTENERGFHNPGVNGVFGSAIAAGKLLELDETRLAWAMGIAGSHAAGLMEFSSDGSMTKRLHIGRASQSGLESALLARDGFTGPATVLEGRYGYLNAVSPSPKPEALLEGLGEKWLSEDMVIKAYSCHVTSQAIVHAIQNFKKGHTIHPEKIGKIEVTSSPRVLADRHLDRRPQTVLGGQYSLPFTVAAALTRDLSNPMAFDEDAISDPTILKLSQRIEFTLSERSTISDEVVSSLITLELDGITHTLDAKDFPGSATQPLDFTEASQKLLNYAEPLVGKDTCQDLIDAVGRLEQADDIALFAQLIANT